MMAGFYTRILILCSGAPRHYSALASYAFHDPINAALTTTRGTG